MRLGIFFIGIMYIVCGDKGDSCLLVQPEHPCIHLFLLRISMILKLNIKMLRSKNLLITQCRLFGFIIQPSRKVSGNLARKTGRERNNPLMVLPEQVKVHPWLIIKTLHKALGYNFHQVLISGIILCQ